MKPRQILPAFCLAMVAVARLAAQDTPTAAETEEANLKAYVELLRRDVKKEKVAILTEMMALLPEEASKFWPVYNEFDKELTKLADERVALIRMYAENYGAMTDQRATQIAMQALELEARRTALKKKYVQQMSTAISGKLAARFLQIENQIEKILDLKISSSLPIVE